MALFRHGTSFGVAMAVHELFCQLVEGNNLIGMIF
jgi:hypothetical protein